MAIEIKTGLTRNQIEFMERMEKEILPNRKCVSMTLLKEVGGLIGVIVSPNCRTCASKVGVEMLNIYSSLKPVYGEYLLRVKLANDEYLDTIKKESPYPIQKNKKKK